MSTSLTLNFLQELLVLGTFALSFSLWRFFKAKLRARSSLETPKVTRSYSKEEQEHAKDSEKQMLQLLAGHEFTRALNQYRSLERGVEAWLSEELFSSFVHAATRMKKVDVVERMLRTMKRIDMTPSLQFWQQTMKIFSSRKSFELCLLAYNLFENKIPADKTVFSCLINAALELERAQLFPMLLERYSQAPLVARDHILHFRCYAARDEAQKAEQLWRRLGDEATSLMLNKLLQMWVNKKEPEHAYRILQEVKTADRVDIVSYNTVMKGFLASKSRSRCLDCLRDLLEQGLRPDDITLAYLLELCVAEGINELADLILKRNVNPAMCSVFIRGLVKGGCVTKALMLYEKSSSRNFDVATYSMLIKALVDQRELVKAVQVAEDLKKQNLLDDIVLTHLLEGCRHEKHYNLGKTIWRDALESGLVPSDVALVTYLKLLGSGGHPQEAYETLRSWEHNYQRKPSVIHYTCLMSGCFRCLHYDQAWAAYQLMLDSGIQADDTTISTLLSGLVQAKQWDRVVEVTKTALRPSMAKQLRQLREVLPDVQSMEVKAVMRKARL